MYPIQDNNQKIVRVTIKSNDVEEAPCFTWFSSFTVTINPLLIFPYSYNNTFSMAT